MERTLLLKITFCLSCKNVEMSLRCFWHNTVEIATTDSLSMTRLTMSVLDTHYWHALSKIIRSFSPSLYCCVNCFSVFVLFVRMATIIITRIWHVPAKHANRMDARAHPSTLAECAPRFMTPRSQGFVGQSSPNLAHV